jgi:glutamyl-tRNA synthetase
VGKSAAAINPGKLDWLNSQYIKRTPLDDLARLARPFIEAKGYAVKDAARLRKGVASFQERVKTLVEMADLSEFYFCEEIVYDEKAAEKFLTADSVETLKQVRASLSAEAVLEKERSHRVVRGLAEEGGVPLVKIAQPLRVALTGKTVSPPIDEVMEALGKAEVIRRIEKAIQYVERR